MTTDDVLYYVGDLFIRYGIPEHIRSDNGPEFTARAVRQWLGIIGVKTLFIEPGSPWENGDSESFNGKLRDEVVNREVFFTWSNLTLKFQSIWQQLTLGRPLHPES
jgi:transposase InsO family protein